MKPFPNSKLSEYTFYFQCLFFLALTVVLVYFNSFYFMLDGENGPIELPGAIILFITAGFLGASAYFSYTNKLLPKYKTYLFIAATLLFIFVAGEEMSWGQHLTGHSTPDWMMELNDQKETNLHNMNKKAFDRWASRFIFLLGALAAIYHFRNKEHILSFRLPEAPLALGLLLLPVYRNFGTIHSDVWDFGFIIFWGYFFLALKRKDKRVLLMTITFALTSLVVFYVHRNFSHLFQENKNIYHEIRESVFAVLCMMYSIQLYRDVKKAALKI